MKQWIVFALVATLFFGTLVIFLKEATQRSDSIGDLLIYTGLTVLGIGVIAKIFGPSATTAPDGWFKFYTIIFAGLWSLGLICALKAYQVPGSSVALITATYNTNTLIACVSGMIWFKEYKTISARWVVAAAICAVLTAVFCARAESGGTVHN